MTEDGVRSRRDRANERQKKGSPLPFVLIGLVVVGAAVGFFVMQALDDGPAKPKPTAGAPPAEGTTGEGSPETAADPPAATPAKTSTLSVRNGVDPETRAAVELATSAAAVADPKEELAFVEVLLPKNGEYRVGGGTIDIQGLTEKLLPYAETKRDLDLAMQPSRVPLLITVDRRVRWREVQWTMQAGAHPDVRIYRMYFTVNGPDGGEGVLPVFLPTDRGLARTRPEGKRRKLTMELKRTKTERVTRVKLLDTEIGVGDEGFAAAGRRILQIADANDELPGEINAWAWVPFEDVVKAITILREAGIGTLTFVGAPPPGHK